MILNNTLRHQLRKKKIVHKIRILTGPNQTGNTYNKQHVNLKCQKLFPLPSGIEVANNNNIVTKMEDDKQQ